MLPASRSARRTSLLAVVLLCALLVTPRPVASQEGVTRADTAAVLLEAAIAFEEDGRWAVAEALYLRVRDMYPGTPAAATAAERLALPVEARREGSGNVEIQVWGTTYGLWLGIAVPAALGAEDSEPYGLGLLLGGPAGLLTARAVTRHRSFTEGQARAITWGGTWGSWQGLGWSQTFEFGDEVVCAFDECYVDDSSEETFLAMIVGGAAGIATGAYFARNPVPLGVVAGANYGSLWGSWIGVAGATVLDVDSDDDALWVSTLMAGNAGLVAGALFAHAEGMSRNRVRLISLGGLVGMLGGFGVDLIVQPDDERAALGIPLATSLVGLAVGTRMTRDHDDGPVGGRGAGGIALLNHGPGGWSVATPLPVPTRLPQAMPTGRLRWTPGVSVELLRAVF